MALQRAVIQKLYDKYCKEARINISNFTKEEEKFRHDKQFELTEKYRARMSDIIDNVKYAEIRKDIMDKNYENAADDVIKIIEKPEMVEARV